MLFAIDEAFLRSSHCKLKPGKYGEEGPESEALALTFDPTQNKFPWQGVWGSPSGTGLGA